MYLILYIPVRSAARPSGGSGGRQPPGKRKKRVYINIKILYIYISSYLLGGRARKGLIRTRTPVTNSTAHTSNATQTHPKST